MAEAGRELTSLLHAPREIEIILGKGVPPSSDAFLTKRHFHGGDLRVGIQPYELLFHDDIMI